MWRRFFDRANKKREEEKERLKRKPTEIVLLA